NWLRCRDAPRLPVLRLFRALFPAKLKRCIRRTNRESHNVATRTSADRQVMEPGPPRRRVRDENSYQSKQPAVPAAGVRKPLRWLQGCKADGVAPAVSASSIPPIPLRL